jgi:hypothetical protein
MPTTFRDFVRLAVELGPATDSMFDDETEATDITSEDDLQDQTQDVGERVTELPQHSEGDDVRVVNNTDDLDFDSPMPERKMSRAAEPPTAPV